MNKKIVLSEGLDFHDMEGQIEPLVTVDEYAAKMGKDNDIVTLSFMVKGAAVGKDLVDWFERGYEWVLDASVSEGEVEVGRYLVFVEMNRRSTVPERIVELLTDLKTLTNMKLTEWTVQVDGEDYDPDVEILKQVIICNPNKYKQDIEKEEELNEMRHKAGIEPKQIYTEHDQELRAYLAKAGL